MRRIDYDSLRETVYCEQLPNGLQVYVVPKPGFRKTFAAFATKYGSIDNHFQAQGGPEIRVPDGIAHFLEHKMFEEPTGDIFAQFASQGASANAFTGFERTVYIFSATERIAENLTTLIDFVQNPYFTDENVEKEKGIIGQEIKMYQDHPDWRSYYGLIAAMYREHPVRIDIAGTIESISQITKETLYDCYRTFYHPSNMMLVVAGGVHAEDVMALVRDNQAAKTFGPQREIRRFFPKEPPEVARRTLTVRLPVSLPKCLLGFKEPQHNLEGRALLERELCTKLVFDALFSPSSVQYQSLYDEHLSPTISVTITRSAPATVFPCSAATRKTPTVSWNASGNSWMRRCPTAFARKTSSAAGAKKSAASCVCSIRRRRSPTSLRITS